MPHIKKIILILSLFTRVGAVLATDQGPIRARLLADVETIAPGQSLRLGIELAMDEGWHTYWQYSGDAGLPIQVDWDLPVGASIGLLEWPLPEKYQEAGDLTVYGYADEVMLLAELVVPDESSVGDTLAITAEVSWLVCREVCIPGRALLEIGLPVGEVRRLGAESALFDRYAALVPGPLDPDLIVDVALRGNDEIEVELHFSNPGFSFDQDDRRPDFFPLAADEFEFSTRRLDAQRLVLSLRPFSGDEVGTVSGVLVYRQDGQARAGELVLDLASAPRRAEPSILQRDFRTKDPEDALSFWVYVVFALLGGLILNLMPCVLPVISLKVLGFVSQAGEEAGRIRQLGWAFCAGILATFLVLALVVLLLKSGGQEIGWGFQFQYPGFVMAMSALVFAMALNLFGVYEILLPGTSGDFGALIGGRGGVTGSFLNGVLATILATPCTAPFLGSALGFAFVQSALVVVVIFGSIGVGMALPYAVLALKPAWIENLPKPGPWMVWFKELMGFLLMATVLWLLWVLGKQIGVEAVVWMGAFLLALGLACRIWGQWGSIQHSARSKTIARLLALVLVLVGYALFLHPLLALEQQLDDISISSADELEWQPFSPERVESLVADGQMVFIDFTAEWCWTCKVNERAVLAQQEVRENFEMHQVALVKADWTDSDPEITQLLRAFGRSGVPLYVIFPAGRIEDPLVLPELITAEMVIEKLAEAASLSGRSNR